MRPLVRRHEGCECHQLGLDVHLASKVPDCWFLAPYGVDFLGVPFRSSSLLLAAGNSCNINGQISKTALLTSNARGRPKSTPSNCWRGRRTRQSRKCRKSSWWSTPNWRWAPEFNLTCRCSPATVSESSWTSEMRQRTTKGIYRTPKDGLGGAQIGFQRSGVSSKVFAGEFKAWRPVRVLRVRPSVRRRFACGRRVAATGISLVRWQRPWRVVRRRAPDNSLWPQRSHSIGRDSGFRVWVTGLRCPSSGSLLPT